MGVPSGLWIHSPHSVDVRSTRKRVSGEECINQRRPERHHARSLKFCFPSLVVRAVTLSRLTLEDVIVGH